MQKLIEIAASQVGIHEEGGNNIGPEIVKFQNATALHPGPWAWCAAFQAWVLQQWLATDEGQAFCITHGMLVADSWRCKHADAFGWEAWAHEKCMKVLPASALAKAGDFVIFNFSHIGIVEIDQIEHQPIHTIEGNTGAAGARDAADGLDGVMCKARAPSLVKCYVRLENAS